MTFYRTDINVWKVCSATNTWTALADDDVPEVGDFGALTLSGDVVSSGLVTTIQANSVALTTDTTGNYALGDAEAGAATTGDSATAFFSAGTVEVARLPLMVGDSGAGGTAGLVIAPAAGDSGKYLRGDATWVTVASGSGDVTDVGAGCATGACWTNNNVTTGTTVMVWEGTVSDSNQVTITAESNPGSAASIALPTASGTLVVSATSPLAVSAAGNLSLGDVALGSGTSGSYAAGDAEAGSASTGDSATAFFSAGAIEAARGGTAIDTSGSTGIAQVAAGTWSVSNNVDLATGTFQTGADSVVSYSPVQCFLGPEMGGGTDWRRTLTSGRYTVTLAEAATVGAAIGCDLTVPSSLTGVAVKVRSVTFYYALTGTAKFDETTLYVETVSAGTFVDVERHTADITSGTSYSYTGVPVTLATGEALKVSLIGITPAASTIAVRGWVVTYDTD